MPVPETGRIGLGVAFCTLGSLGFLGVPWDHDGPWLQLRSPLVYGLTHECEDIADRAMIYLYNLYIYIYLVIPIVWDHCDHPRGVIQVGAQFSL